MTWHRLRDSVLIETEKREKEVREILRENNEREK